MRKFSLRTLHHSKQKEAPRVTASNSASNLPHRIHCANQVSEIVTIFSDRVSKKAGRIQYQESKAMKSWLALTHTSTREDPRGSKRAHMGVHAKFPKHISSYEKVSFSLLSGSVHIPARYGTSLFPDNHMIKLHVALCSHIYRIHNNSTNT